MARRQGWLDLPRTELGRGQAAARCLRVAGLPAMRMSSPLGRAVEAAWILFGGPDGTFHHRLAEIAWGDHAGLFLANLRRDMLKVFAGLPTTGTAVPRRARVRRLGRPSFHTAA